MRKRKEFSVTAGVSVLSEAFVWTYAEMPSFIASNHSAGGRVRSAFALNSCIKDTRWKRACGLMNASGWLALCGSIFTPAVS